MISLPSYIFMKNQIWDISGLWNRSDGRDFREKLIAFSSFLTLYKPRRQVWAEVPNFVHVVISWPLIFIGTPSRSVGKPFTTNDFGQIFKFGDLQGLLCLCSYPHFLKICQWMFVWYHRNVPHFTKTNVLHISISM